MNSPRGLTVLRIGHGETSHHPYFSGVLASPQPAKAATKLALDPATHGASDNVPANGYPLFLQAPSLVLRRRTSDALSAIYWHSKLEVDRTEDESGGA